MIVEVIINPKTNPSINRGMNGVNLGIFVIKRMINPDMRPAIVVMTANCSLFNFIKSFDRITNDTVKPMINPKCINPIK